MMLLSLKNKIGSSFQNFTFFFIFLTSLILSFSDTKNELIYIDTIYNPLETRTLKYLKNDGRKVFNGLDMFIYQGQKSFYLWNKINPEIDNGLIELLNSKLKK